MRPHPQEVMQTLINSFSPIYDYVSRLEKSRRESFRKILEIVKSVYYEGLQSEAATDEREKIFWQLQGLRKAHREFIPVFKEHKRIVDAICKELNIREDAQ